MPKTPHDLSIERFARDLRDRRGYMQERPPIVSVRERWVHVAVIGAIAAMLLIGKVVAAVPLVAGAAPTETAASVVTTLSGL